MASSTMRAAASRESEVKELTPLCKHQSRAMALPNSCIAAAACKEPGEAVVVQEASATAVCIAAVQTSLCQQSKVLAGTRELEAAIIPSSPSFGRQLLE